MSDKPTPKEKRVKTSDQTIILQQEIDRKRNKIAELQKEVDEKESQLKTALENKLAALKG